MDLSSIGKRIRSVRESKSWRQEDLAEKADLSSTYIGMIERGERVPKLETFVELINVLDISADEILCDVLKCGYQIRMSKYAEKAEKLNERDRKRFYEVMDAYLECR